MRSWSDRRRRRSPIASAIAVAVGLGFAAPVSAQSSATANSAKWEIEVHGGLMAPHDPSEGTGALPPVLPPPSGLSGTPTRAVSSWFFGDGAVLLSQALASIGLRQSIVSADPLAQSVLAERGAGGVMGVRIGRGLSRRLGVELSVDYAASTWTIGSRERSQLETTRASFESSWLSLFARPGLTTAREVTATAAIDERRAAELTITGAATIAVGSIGRVRPYVAAGGGVLSHRGDLPSVTLDGHYNLALNLPIPIVVPTTGIDERDAVAIRATASERQFIGVVGGGFRHEISPRLALRVDVREHIGRNTGRTVVDATPGVAPRQSGNAIFTIGTTPPLVFSTIPAVSTLSGPRLSAFTTFEGRGVSAQLHLTAGLAWRF